MNLSEVGCFITKACMVDSEYTSRYYFSFLDVYSAR